MWQSRQRLGMKYWRRSPPNGSEVKINRASGGERPSAYRLICGEHLAALKSRLIMARRVTSLRDAAINMRGVARPLKKTWLAKTSQCGGEWRCPPTPGPKTHFSRRENPICLRRSENARACMRGNHRAPVTVFVGVRHDARPRRPCRAIAS